jgi:hypothetical protein
MNTFQAFWPATSFSLGHILPSAFQVVAIASVSHIDFNAKMRIFPAAEQLVPMSAGSIQECARAGTSAYISSAKLPRNSEVHEQHTTPQGDAAVLLQGVCGLSTEGDGGWPHTNSDAVHHPRA